MRLARRSHLDWIQDGPLRLSFDVRRATIPELRDMKSGVVDRRGVSAATLAAMTGRSGLGIDAVGIQQVARIA